MIQIVQVHSLFSCEFLSRRRKKQKKKKLKKRMDKKRFVDLFMKRKYKLRVNKRRNKSLVPPAYHKTFIIFYIWLFFLLSSNNRSWGARMAIFSMFFKSFNFMALFRLFLSIANHLKGFFSDTGDCLHNKCLDVFTSGE